MSALALGCVAALCWAFHDLCVRFLSQRTPISACLFTVLVVGLVLHAGLVLATETSPALPAAAMLPAVLAGVCFVVATIGLYISFQRGPVRLVAPLIASYPVFSIAWAVLNGADVTLWQWLAVLAIVAGVGWVAALSDSADDEVPPIGPTIGFALLAALGFACTFAFGQMAADLSHEIAATLLTRIVAVIVAAVALLLTRQPFWPGRAALGWLIAMGAADFLALWSVMAAGPLPDAEFAAVTASMFGLLTILLAWIFLRERMTAAQWLGCAVAFAGVGYLAL